MNSPFFTVIIPTRERSDTLYHSLKTVVGQTYPYLRIIVSDNFSQDDTRKVVESFSDKRISYINTGRRLGMSQNWEFALNHVTDGWVSYLGDDDGLMPGCLEKVAQTILDLDCDAVVTRWSHYFWPGCTEWENQLQMPICRGHELRDSKLWLTKLLNGTAAYSELPMLYTGAFVRKSKIDAARDEKNTFFLSSSPDVYSAIAIALVTDTYAMLNESVALCGVSSHSNGASWLGLSKNPEAARKFLSEENIPFHTTLAPLQVSSLSLVVYESYLQAAHLHIPGFKVDLADQLQLAVESSAKENRSAVIAYCNGIAKQNALSASLVTRSKTIERSLRWNRRRRRVRRIYQEITIDARSFGVEDICGATNLANYVSVFLHEYRYWRIRNFLKEVMRSLRALWIRSA